MDARASAAAGWHADPTTPGQLRWWDGATWTEHTAPDPAATPAPMPELRVAAIATASMPAASVPDVEPMPAQRASSRDRTEGGGRARLVAAALLLVVCAAGWLLLRDGEAAAPSTPAGPATTGAPTSSPTDATADAPGSAVPTAIDGAMGNGVTKSQDTAAAMQQQLDATAAVTGEDPTVAP